MVDRRDSMYHSERVTSEGRRSTSTVYKILEDPRRCRLLDTLHRCSQTEIDREYLAYRLAAEESGSNRPPDRQVRRIDIQLHHNHLPVLEEADVVSYQSEQERVRIDRGGRLVDLLLHLDDRAIDRAVE